MKNKTEKSDFKANINLAKAKWEVKHSFNVPQRNNERTQKNLDSHKANNEQTQENDDSLKANKEFK